VSGAIATWTNECPLEGRCSECGLDFAWTDVLGPLRRVPKWFFETAKRKKIRAATSTSVRTLMPWHFWKCVPLHAPVSTSRLAVNCGAGLVVAYLTTAAMLLVQPMSEVFGTHPINGMGYHAIFYGGSITDRALAVLSEYWAAAMK